MLIVNIAGFLLIGLIIWWFWLYKPKAVETNLGVVKVVVENGSYQPSRISLKADQPNQIEFFRKDANPCTEIVLFPDFEISQALALDKTTIINLPALPAGEYPFHCQMQMVKGTLVVK